ncbi:MAG: S1 RNA-binding domain-containing protein [Anaerolineae bacterium]
MINPTIQKETQSDFAALLEQYTRVVPKLGDIYEGIILRIEGDAIFVDIGAKSDAIIDSRELELMDDATADKLSRGDKLPIMIENLGPKGSLIQGSLEKGLASQDWKEALSLYANDEAIDVRVVQYNKGGVLARFRRITGFIPNSHLSAKFSGGNLQAIKAKMIDELITVKFLEIDQAQDRLMLSSKKAEHEEQKELLAKLVEGQVVTGTVVNTKPYGVFVDIGNGLVGLVHISKLSHNKISRPEDAVALGQTISVKIDNIDIEKNQIGLDHKVTLPHPLEKLAKEFDPLAPIAGKVTHVADYGAFIEITDGCIGLLHVSQMPSWMADDHKESLQIGEELLVTIQSVDAENNRVSLTHRNVSDSAIVNWMRRDVNDDEAEASLD